MNNRKLSPIREGGHFQAIRSPLTMVVMLTILLGTGNFQVFKSWLLMAGFFTVVHFQYAAEIDSPRWLKATIVFTGIIIMIMCIGLAFYTQTRYRN